MNHRTPIDRDRATRGFSIIELLIAIIIIGILVSILIPVIANRSNDARLARAHQDIENLANAQERLGTDTGYLGRLYVLNDVVGGDGVAFSPQNVRNGTEVIDGLRDHGIGGEYFQNGRYIFIDPRTGELAGPPGNTAIGDQLYASIQRNETAFGWHGPYINWQIDNNHVDAGIVGPDGLPDDPWGNNYLFFTREGLVKEPEGQVLDSVSFPFPEDNTSGLPTATYSCLRFDRATILSLGPNGVPGDGGDSADAGQFGQGDDIVRKFGQ